MTQPLLELRNVTKEFNIGGGLGAFLRRTIKALDSVSFLMPSDRPMITALVGESGSGKTTLARLILGLLEPTSGEVLYKDKKITEWFKRDKITYLKEVQPIFQDPYSAYNPFYRIERVLEIIIRKFKLASSEVEKKELILKAMRDIGLRPEDLIGRYPHQLSGGERQRFMLTRILLIRPRLIIADEPVSMIDVSLRAIFLDHLLMFKEKFGISCLYITHDLNTASYVSDNIIVLCAGKIIEEGPKNAIIKEPLHPYTKLLMSSIPTPNPKSRWKEEINLALIEPRKDLKLAGRCAFLDRCSHATNACLEKVPSLSEIKPDRKVSCFQYIEDKP